MTSHKIESLYLETNIYTISNNTINMNSQITEQLPMAVVSSPYFQQWNKVLEDMYFSSPQETVERIHRKNLQFLMLDLYAFFTKRVEGIYKSHMDSYRRTDINFTGNIYKTEYITALHRKCKAESYIPFNMVERGFYKICILSLHSSPIDLYKNSKSVKTFYELQFRKKFGYEEETVPEPTEEEMKKFWKGRFISDNSKDYQTNCQMFEYRETQHNMAYKTHTHKYPKRCVVKTMDLTKTPRDYYSVLNVKHWDATTKKTSNKGLVADTTYSYSADSGCRGGWTFGGLEAHSLKDMAILNGFPVVKKVKYQYGDYALWILKTLV